MPRHLLWNVSCLLLVALVRSVAAQQGAEALEGAMAEGERRLQAGDVRGAETRYRAALFEGWLLRGTLARIEQQRDAARAAYDKAAAFAIAPEQRRELGAAYVACGDGARAVDILQPLAKDLPGDVPLRRLLVRALAATGEAERAARELAALGAAAEADPETAFVVATEFLWLKRPDEAERFFARLRKARPLPQTRVIIGHAYRDAGEYDRARHELEGALVQEPKLRRAHYTLASVLLADASLGPERRARAIAEYREELKLAPDDAQTCDALGLELLDAGSADEALALFESAARGEPRASYVAHVGRAQLALGRPAEAAAWLRRALELTRTQPVGDADREKIHYQLGLAARKVGAAAEAAENFAAARQLASRWNAPLRSGGEAEASAGPFVATALTEESPLASLAPEGRGELRRRVSGALTRACFNLAVIQAQGEHFDDAATLLDEAAAIDPDFPNLHYSLGVARFKAGRFAAAVEPLARALAASPADPWLRRALALAALNSGGYARAAELLKDDPERAADPSLEFSYGLALAGCHRAGEARQLFERLRAQHGSTPELEAALRRLNEQR